MNITDVRVRKVESEGKTKAFVSVTFDNIFVVHDIRVIEGDGGLFIAMPSKRGAGGDRVEIVHPLTRDFRSALQARILEEYDRS